MTSSTPEPARPSPRADYLPAPHGLLYATAVIATVGVVVALLGLALLLRPVSTPTQDCGTSLGFLLEGRVNEFVSESDPPQGVTAAEAKANNAEPCRERVAGRTKPAAVLLSAGVIAAVGAALIEMTVRGIAWLKRRKARREPGAQATSVPVPPPVVTDPTVGPSGS